MAGTGGSPENWKLIPNYGTGTEVVSSSQLNMRLKMVAECIAHRARAKDADDRCYK